MTPKELMRQCRRDHARRAELQSVIADALRLVDWIGRGFPNHTLAWLVVDAYYLDPAMPTWDQVGAALDCPKSGSTVRGWSDAALWWAGWRQELHDARHDADAM